MKISDKGSKVVKRAVKIFLTSSLVLGYFVYMNIKHVYDLIFAIVFIVLIFKYFKLED